MPARPPQSPIQLWFCTLIVCGAVGCGPHEDPLVGTWYAVTVAGQAVPYSMNSASLDLTADISEVSLDVMKATRLSATLTYSSTQRLYSDGQLVATTDYQGQLGDPIVVRDGVSAHYALDLCCEELVEGISYITLQCEIAPDALDCLDQTGQLWFFER